MHLRNVLIKPASGKCNMSCDYCFYCDEASKREQADYGMMSEETIRNIIRKSLFQAQADMNFAFQGGEPTLRGISFFEKVMELEKKYNRNQVRVTNSLQTNGLGIDEKWCRFFAENHFLIGISVDGIQDTHDQNRHTGDGKPTYDRIRRSVCLLEEYQVEYNILTVVNSHTASQIRKIYQEYRRNGWKYQQYITCLEPLGEPEGGHPYSLNAQMYGRFLIELFELWYKDWKRGRAPYIRQFENYIGILMGYPPEACEQRGVCSMQGVVEADGSVYPCDFYAIDQYKIGNFNDDKVSSFFEHERTRAFIAKSKELSPVCRECKYYLLCRGGCRRHRKKEDDTDTYRSRFCESYLMFFEKEADKLQEIAKYLRR